MYTDKYSKLQEGHQAKLNFKSNSGVSKEEFISILEFQKGQLFNSPQSLQRHYFDIMNKSTRDAQKTLVPGKNNAWYRRNEVFAKKGDPDTGPHLEHTIPFGVGMNLYLQNDISAEELLYHPTTWMFNRDKDRLKTSVWETKAFLPFPFQRYVSASIDCEIINIRGVTINLQKWSIDDHFDLVGLV